MNYNLSCISEKCKSDVTEFVYYELGTVVPLPEKKKKKHDEEKGLEDKRGHMVVVNGEKYNSRCSYSCQVRISIFHWKGYLK